MAPIILLITATVVLVIVIIVVIWTYGRLLHKVGPNQALIISGYGGVKVVTGGSSFVMPLYQRAQYLSLELMSFELPFVLDLSPAPGGPVHVQAVALIKVRSDAQSVLTAAEQFLSKSQQERDHLIRLVVEGHLHGVIDQLSGEERLSDTEQIATHLLQTTRADLNRMGLEMISFTLKRDTSPSSSSPMA
jgi:flotillin